MGTCCSSLHICFLTHMLYPVSPLSSCTPNLETTLCKQRQHDSDTCVGGAVLISPPSLIATCSCPKASSAQMRYVLVPDLKTPTPSTPRRRKRFDSSIYFVRVQLSSLCLTVLYSYLVRLDKV